MTDKKTAWPPLLVAQCDHAAVLSEIKLAVDAGPPVVVLQRLGLPDQSVRTVAWDDLVQHVYELRDRMIVRMDIV